MSCGFVKSPDLLGLRNASLDYRSNEVLRTCTRGSNYSVAKESCSQGVPRDRKSQRLAASRNLEKSSPLRPRADRARPSACDEGKKGSLPQPQKKAILLPIIGRGTGEGEESLGRTGQTINKLDRRPSPCPQRFAFE